MWKSIRTRDFSLGIIVAALSALTTTPAWAFAQLPGPEAGGIAGVAIIGAILIAKWWRRK